jgi:hypothetical protein
MLSQQQQDDNIVKLLKNIESKNHSHTIIHSTSPHLNFSSFFYQQCTTTTTTATTMMMMKTPVYFDNILSLDCLYHIMEYMPLKYLLFVKQVNKRLYTILNENEFWRRMCQSLCVTYSVEEEFVNSCMIRARKTHLQYQSFLFESGVLHMDCLVQLVDSVTDCAIVSFGVPGINSKKHVLLLNKSKKLYLDVYQLPVTVQILYNPLFIEMNTHSFAVRVLFSNCSCLTSPKQILYKQVSSVDIRTWISKYAKLLVECQSIIDNAIQQGYQSLLEETVQFLHEFNENPDRAETDFLSDRVLIGLHFMLLDNIHFYNLSMQLFNRILPIEFYRLLNIRFNNQHEDKIEMMEFKPRQGAVIHSVNCDLILQHLHIGCHSAVKLRNKIRKKYSPVVNDYYKWLQTNESQYCTHYTWLCLYFHMLHPLDFFYDMHRENNSKNSNTNNNKLLLINLHQVTKHKGIIHKIKNFVFLSPPPLRESLDQSK